MANELQVRISADIQALQSALTKAKKTIQEFEKSTEQESEKSNVGFRRKIGLIESLEKKASQLRVSLRQALNEDQVERYNKELQETTSELARLNALGRNLGQANNSLAGGFNNVTKSVGNANGVAIEFNRIIQDAPFGLIGIGNNIQQLTQSFATLKDTQGGTGAALRATFASLISPANLLVLGISAVTAAFTAYQMGAFDGLFATKNLADATEEYRDSLSTLRQVQLDSLKDADKEIITLNSLRSIIESETTSREQKNKAIEKLQSDYPAYFGNMTKEQILAGNLQNTYEALTKTLIARATAEASINKVVDLQDEERVLLEKTADVRARIAKEEQTLQRFREQGQKELVTIQENTIRFLQNQNPELARLAEIDSERNQLTADINKNLADANLLLPDTKAKVDDITKSFGDLNIEAVEFLNSLRAESQSTFNELAHDLQKALRSELTGLENALTAAISDGDVQAAQALRERIANVKTQLRNFSNEVKPVNVPINFTTETTGIEKEPGIIEGIRKQIEALTKARDVATDPSRIAAYNEQIQFAQEQLNQFTKLGSDTQKFFEEIFKSLEVGVENSIGDIAFSIGEALASGNSVLEAGGAALLGGLAAILNQLGQLAIATGIAIEGIKTALKTLNPVVAIGAGVALIALAGFVSAKAKSLGNARPGGGGGSVSGFSGASSAPSQSFTNANRPTAFSPALGSFSGGTFSGARLEATIDMNELRFNLNLNGEKARRS